MAIPFCVASSLILPTPDSCGNRPLSSSFSLFLANNLASRAATLCSAVKQATESEKREPKGIMKPRRVSPEMQAFLGGVSEVPRTEVLKEVWSHIKLHNLQDSSDKKIIICDEKLKLIFAGRDEVGFLEIARLINPHFLK